MTMALLSASVARCSAQQAAGQATSTSAPDATTVTLETISALPESSRDWESLQQLSSQANDATLAGGSNGDVEAQADDGNARVESNSAEASATGESYAGQSPTQNAVALDGLSAQQNFRSVPRGGAASGSTFAQGAVGSFRVMPRTYSAAYGNAAGAVLAVQSRAGSEALHGAATLLFRESAFDAANPFSVVTSYHDGAIASSVVKPQNSMTEMAAHVGLPLGDWLDKRFQAAPLRKRLVLFASYEEELRNDPVVSSPATASFYALTPTQTALLENRGLTAPQINAALDYIDSLTGQCRAARPACADLYGEPLSLARRCGLRFGFRRGDGAQPRQRRRQLHCARRRGHALATCVQPAHGECAALSVCARRRA
jgi:hypothetical protein